MRPVTSTAFRTGFLVLALFTVLAADAWRYTISWWGWGAVAVAIVVVAVILLVRARRAGTWTWSQLPMPLYAFLALTLVSVAWSAYRPETLLGVLATLATTAVALAVALVYRWEEIARGLGLTLRIILGLSLLFELYGDLDPIPKLLLWSRNELFQVFDGGRIQGLVGNSSTLAFIALLGVIVFGIQLAARTVYKLSGGIWLGVAVVTLLLTKSATIAVALVIVAAVLGAVLLLRSVPVRARLGTAIGLIALAAAAVVTAVLARGPLLGLLGRSDDLTNRLDIWDKVIGLAVQRPAAGWGWVGYWPPWVPPFNDLLKVNDVQVMHAHNAWLDVWLQLGIIGLVVFGAYVLSTLVRSWSVALDRPAPGGPGPRYRAIDILPLLLLVALLVQSLAESRLLIEYGFLLLTVIAVTTKRWRT
jgi:O-antigen ligase